MDPIDQSFCLGILIGILVGLSIYLAIRAFDHPDDDLPPPPGAP